jgi:hypothetical protein
MSSQSVRQDLIPMLKMIRYLFFYKANQFSITRLGMSIGPSIIYR